MIRIGRALAWVWWHIDPTRLFDYIPGFREGYEEQYNIWADRENRKANSKLGAVNEVQP